MEQRKEAKGKSETSEVEKQVHKYHERNPFIGEVAIHIEETQRRKVMGTSYQDVVVQETGETTKQKISIFGEKKKVDKQQYMKLFLGQIKKFFELSKTSMKLLDYIMEQIRYNKDRICLHQPTVMDELKISRTTCYRSIVQLLDAQIIAKADTEGCFFVNPTVVFKGDRLVLWKEYQMQDEKVKPYVGMPEINMMVKEPEMSEEDQLK